MDSHLAGRRPAGAVGDVVGESGLADVAHEGRERCLPTDQGHRPMLSPSYRRHSQGVAIRIGVVGHEARC